MEDIPAEDYRARSDFERLTPLFPKERLLLENKGGVNSAAMRVLDLMTPFGKGQRGLIVAPRAEENRSSENNRPFHQGQLSGSGTDCAVAGRTSGGSNGFEETVDAPVFASTFDEPSRRHAQVSDLVIERAKRLVEMGRDVVILLDSLTRLARGYQCQPDGRTHHVRRPGVQCIGKTAQILFRGAQWKKEAA